MNAAYLDIRRRLEAAAARAGHAVALLAVSKTQSIAAIRALAGVGQVAFGENYVQELVAKRAELTNLKLEWHQIGPLQSNKCREIAEQADWLQSLDREKLIAPLDRWRPSGADPLNVLIQVNIDAEASKSGCTPDEIEALAAAVALAPHLRLRGLMAIPAAAVDRGQRRASFEKMRALFDRLRGEHTAVDTLSMGMSEDFELAIAAGATMVRVGSALFGAR